ncbi:MAG: GrpB family protein [Anaerolineae bacterium]|jgi:GrpB-like predicted nucleotidyltransferase (UPF0157 family)
MKDRATDSPRSNPPLTEEQIMAATVGERKPLNSSIYLAPYDPAWPSLFAQLKQDVQAALGDDILLLEHVGSTSVPGLSAKPIIDMVMVVADSSDEPAYVPRLEEQGFTLWIREPDWYEHRVLKAPDIPGNLHVFSEGCEEIEQMLLFRDWLRSHADDRLLYEETKRELAARTWKYTQNYADAKASVVREILDRARHYQP